VKYLAKHARISNGGEVVFLSAAPLHAVPCDSSGQEREA